MKFKVYYFYQGLDTVEADSEEEAKEKAMDKISVEHENYFKNVDYEGVEGQYHGHIEVFSDDDIDLMIKQKIEDRLRLQEVVE